VKVERHTITKDDERHRTPRPKGNRISYSQLSSPCDLRLKFRRERVVVDSQTGVSLLLGRAFHEGIEAFLRGAARTPRDAALAGVAAFEKEISTSKVRWDDWHEVNKDGTVSQSPKGNFGRIPSIEFGRFWLERQLPLYIAVFGSRKLLFSEKSIYVPLTPQPNWSGPWSVEAWLDIVLDAEPGYQIVDPKTSPDQWEANDYQKFTHQADVYMGAASVEWSEPPAHPFEFHVLPRLKAALPVLEQARAWAFDGVPFSSNEGIEFALQIHEVDYNPERINTYIKGVMRPRITMIEAGAFAANPQGWHCSEKWCDYWKHCAFGSGDHL
jgi:hypothetical protein